MARQAELRVPPEKTVAIPAFITPVSPPLIGLRRRSHSFTITTTLLEDQQTPRSLLGQLRVRPLIGPFLIALCVLVLLALVVLIFRPRINDFQVEPEIIRAGEAVTLNWRAPRFTNLTLATDTDAVLPPLEDSSGQMSDHPQVDQTYTLQAENWLSQLVPLLGRLRDTRAEKNVAVDPVYPSIRVFTIDQERILMGQTVSLRWEVLNAEEVILSINGNEEKLLSTEHTGERELSPVQNPTDYTLRATNRYGFDTDSLQVTVLVPTATPLPPPVVRRFLVQPLSITEGQTVTLEWDVGGATRVLISNLNQEYPAQGNTQHSPPATTDYVLTAFYEEEGKTVSTVSAPWTVVVNPKPEPPEIVYFRTEPEEVIKNESTQVQLLWSISGDTTNVEINGPSLGTTFSNLSAEGQLPVVLEDATFFILTAYNGDEIASQTAQLTSVEPTPAPPTPLPPPIISYFVLDENDPNVTRTGSDPANDLIQYEVAGGSTVMFMWLADNVDNVSLLLDGVSLGEYPPESTLQQMVLGPGQYQLKATNPEDVSANAYIRITLRPVTPPDPPHTISGQQAAPNETITVTWMHDDPNSLVGFRVYRATVPYNDFSDFVQVADETELDNLQTSWTDPDTGCNWAYTVRAVYKDELGQNQEVNDPSPEVWQTWPCP
jgi:hypothetical protein